MPKRDAPTQRKVFEPEAVDQILSTGAGLLGALSDDDPESWLEQVDRMLSTGPGLPGTPSEKDRESWLDHEVRRWLGRKVGPYKITQYLDRGGMSLVFRAQRCDGQFEQNVAIKVLHTPQAQELAQRFEQERRLLGRLQHPGIAHIIDSGISDGQSWLAMELIDGEPIDDYCDRHQLGLHERLDLFAEIASAVQFAHSQLIVHRDLKPSNILVNRQGQVKLLDFGIAKALSGSFEPELTGPAPLLTPLFASPEQVLGQPVGIASDVYQLGLLLYQLLTGQHAQAMDGISVAEIKSVVVDSEPLKPSARITSTSGRDAELGKRIAEARRCTVSKLQRHLSGDLDAIVLHALQKPAEQRYATVAQLVGDVQSFREHRPISARPVNSWYVTQQFARRHWGGVLAGTLMMVVVLGSLIAIGTSWRDKINAQRTALAEAERANQVGLFLTNMIENANPKLSGGGQLSSTKGLLDSALPEIAKLDAQPELQASLQLLFGRTYTALGDFVTAISLNQAAVERWQALDNQSQVAVSLSALADAYSGSGNPQQAEIEANKALKLIAATPSTPPLIKAELLYTLSTQRIEQGDYARQRELLEQVAALLAGDSNKESQMLRINTQLRLIQNSIYRSDFAALGSQLNKAWELLDNSDRFRFERYLLLGSEAWRLSALGANEAALAKNRQALALTEKIFAADHYHKNFAAEAMASNLISLDRLDQAATILDGVLANFEDTLGVDHPRAAVSLFLRGEACYRSGQFDCGKSYQQRAVAAATIGANLHEKAAMEVEQAHSMLLEHPTTESALALTSAITQAESTLTNTDLDLHATKVALARAWLALGKPALAQRQLATLFEQGRQIWPEGFPGQQAALLGLAELALARSELAQALAFTEQAVAMGQVLDGGTLQSLLEPLTLQARILLLQDNRADAGEVAERAWQLAQDNWSTPAIDRLQQFGTFSVTLAELGQVENARQLCSHALSILTNSITESHPFLRDTTRHCQQVAELAGPNG